MNLCSFVLILFDIGSLFLSWYKFSVTCSVLQIGVVSDDELLTLLDVALSADTANTVKRARELMKSRVDPMQLVSQLANLIMDILAGRRQLRCSEFCRTLVEQQTCMFHGAFHSNCVSFTAERLHFSIQ